MKTILVATDFSQAARNAVEYAAQMCKITGAELVLFNVYKTSIHAKNARSSITTMDHLIQKNEARLKERANEIIQDHGIKVKTEQRMDQTIANLKDYTSKHHVDMVVMGIESNLVEYKIFGNTTTDAIRLMQFPLLVVPNDVEFSGLNKIMYACESAYLKEGCELGFLKNLVNGFKAELEVFHVIKNDPDQESNEELEAVMNRILHDVKHTFSYVNNPNVGDGIQARLEFFPADLLVMIPHKLGFFESIIKGSHTSQMSVKTRVPLLVIPNDKAC